MKRDSIALKKGSIGQIRYFSSALIPRLVHRAYDAGADGDSKINSTSIRLGIITYATDSQSANRLLAPVQYFCESSAMSLALFTILVIASGITCLHAITVAQIVAQRQVWSGIAIVSRC